MKNIFSYIFILLIGGLAVSCDNGDEMYGTDTEKNQKLAASNSSTAKGAKTRAATGNDYYLEFDIYDNYGEKFQTFIISEADGRAFGDRNPFPFYEDDERNLITVSDYSQYDAICDGKTRIHFDERGLRSSVAYRYDNENGIGYHYTMNVGDKIAIWASKEKYTFNDLRDHDGDDAYFENVSRTFQCYCIATLGEKTLIRYGKYDDKWEVFVEGDYLANLE